MSRITLFAGLLTILPFALAQSYPACAMSCVYDVTAITQAGCLSSDGYCLCTSQSYLKETTCCVRSNCDSADQKTAFARALYVCSTWGVTLNTAESVTCSAATTTASNPTQATNTATFASITVVPLANTNPKYHPKKGLSAGAKGGIGAGVGVVVLAISSLAGFLLKRRNDKKKAAAAVPAAAAGQVAAAPSAPAGYSEKDGTIVTVNQAPPPQYPQQPQGQYPLQSSQQYQPPPFQPYAPPNSQTPQPQYAPQPPQTPQPQYAPQPSQTPQPQYALQPAQSPQPQYQYPQQNQLPVYNAGPELQGSPVVQNQPLQGWNSAELPAPGTVQPRHEAP